jgi:hypothetical protein
MLLDFAVQHIAERFDVSTAVYMVTDAHQFHAPTYRTWTGSQQVREALSAYYTYESCDVLAIKLHCECWVSLHDVTYVSPYSMSRAEMCTIDHSTRTQEFKKR